MSKQGKTKMSLGDFYSKTGGKPAADGVMLPEAPSSSGNEREMGRSAGRWERGSRDREGDDRPSRGRGYGDRDRNSRDGDRPAGRGFGRGGPRRDDRDGEGGDEESRPTRSDDNAWRGGGRGRGGDSEEGGDRAAGPTRSDAGAWRRSGGGGDQEPSEDSGSSRSGGGRFSDLDRDRFGGGSSSRGFGSNRGGDREDRWGGGGRGGRSRFGDNDRSREEEGEGTPQKQLPGRSYDEGRSYRGGAGRGRGGYSGGGGDRWGPSRTEGGDRDRNERWGPRGDAREPASSERPAHLRLNLNRKPGEGKSEEKSAKPSASEMNSDEAFPSLASAKSQQEKQVADKKAAEAKAAKRAAENMEKVKAAAEEEEEEEQEEEEAPKPEPKKRGGPSPFGDARPVSVRNVPEKAAPAAAENTEKPAPKGRSNPFGDARPVAVGDSKNAALAPVSIKGKGSNKADEKDISKGKGKKNDEPAEDEDFQMVEKPVAKGKGSKAAEESNSRQKPSTKRNARAEEEEEEGDEEGQEGEGEGEEGAEEEEEEDERPKGKKGKGKELPKRELAAELQKDVVDSKKLVSPLEQAVRDKESVNVDILADHLQGYKLGDATRRGGLAVTLARSLADESLDFKDMVEVVGESSSDNAADLLVETMQAFKDKKGERALNTLVTSSGVEMVPIVAKGLEGDDLNKWLEEKGLLCIKPVTDLTEQVAAGLKEGKSPADILSLVTKQVDEKQSAAYLAPTVATAMLSRVYADAKSPKADVLESYTDLLKRTVKNDLEAQSTLLFAVQGAWFDATKGNEKASIATLFTKLHESGVVSAEAVRAWKDDKANKTKGKPQALLKIGSKWVEDVLRTIKEEDEEEPQGGEGDEGDEGEEEQDPYLVNPNIEFKKGK